MTYERITAGEIRPGDTVARSRTHMFTRIDEVREGPVAVSLYTRETAYDRYRGRRIVWARPRKTAKWWREVA
jgi:hypothetical protein